MKLTHPATLPKIAFILLSITASSLQLAAAQSKYDPGAKSSGRFVDRGEYVEDTKTGLLWQKDGEAAGKKNFYEAAEYAKNLRLGDMMGWRVPTREELAEIFPATDLPFTNTGYNPEKCCGGDKEFRSYWTSNLDERVEDYAFLYHWYDKGGANNGNASRNFVNVRCVHSKPSGAPSKAKTTTKKIADLIKNVGHEDRRISSKAMLELQKLGPAAIPAIREEVEKQKRRLTELEILLDEPARP